MSKRKRDGKKDPARISTVPGNIRVGRGTRQVYMMGSVSDILRKPPHDVRPSRDSVSTVEVQGSPSALQPGYQLRVKKRRVMIR